MHEHCFKTATVFLTAGGGASWSLLPSSVSLLSADAVLLGGTYSSVLGVAGRVWGGLGMDRRQRGSQLPQAGFGFGRPSWGGWGAGLVGVGHLHCGVFLLWRHRWGLVSQGWWGAFFPWGGTVAAGQQPSNIRQLV